MIWYDILYYMYKKIYYIILNFNILYYIILYYIILYFIIFYYIIIILLLYYIIINKYIYIYIYTYNIWIIYVYNINIHTFVEFCYWASHAGTSQEGQGSKPGAAKERYQGPNSEPQLSPPEGW